MEAHAHAVMASREDWTTENRTAILDALRGVNGPDKRREWLNQLKDAAHAMGWPSLPPEEKARRQAAAEAAYVAAANE